MYRKILVPLDGSEEAELALERADLMCSQVSDAELIIVRIVELVGLANSAAYAILRALEEAEEEVESYLKAVTAKVKCPRVVIVSKKGARPADLIAQEARERDVDLIVMTSQGRSAFQEFMVGSQTTRTLRMAPCSVLVVRDKPRDPD